MNEADKIAIEKQLASIIEDHANFQRTSEHKDLSGLPKDDRQSFVTRAIAAVRRISGSESTYSQEVRRILENNPALHVHTSPLIGVVKALKHDVAAGYLQTLVELVHAEIFADLLDMALHLHESGCKDAAAVICGSTLESHLRELCTKYGVAAEANGKPKKAEQLNADLAKSGAYSGLDQKNVTAWLGLRNKAAHGDYGGYSAEQVAIFISGVRDFITRTPA